MQRKSRVKGGLAVSLVMTLCLASGCATPVLPSATRGTAPSTLSAGDAETAIDDASKGDVFALERAMDLIADPDLAAIARARSSAARLQESEAVSILAALSENPAVSSDHRGLAWSVLADASFARGDYASARQATAKWLKALNESAAPPQLIASATQMDAIAQTLSRSSPQVVASFAPAPVSVSPDKVGLPRARITINGMQQEAILDTGANISVVSQSTAKRLGLRILEGQNSVGSSSRDAVPTQIGIADNLEFAGLHLKNVAFLILEDTHLTFPLPGGYSIDAIVGFPVFRQFKRMRFDRAGTFTPEPELAGTTDAIGNLRVVGNSLYVQAAINGIPVSLHLDSGGSASSLSALFSKRHAGFVEGLSRQEERIAGAGGATTRVASTLSGAQLSIANRSVIVPELSVQVSDGPEVESSNFGLLGNDVLGQFSSWSIDLVNMNFELGLELDRVGPSSN